MSRSNLPNPSNPPNSIVCAALVCAGLAVGAAGCNKQKDGSGAGAVDLADAVNLGGITVRAPKPWTFAPPTSDMRRGQWTIPAAGGATEPAELIVYHFGAGGAGTVQANLDRWYGQFQQPDGKSTKDAAQTVVATIAGMQVTKTEVSGRYVAQVRPGAGERHDVADARMLAAIVEAPDGAYYFKMVGPDAVVAAARPGFDAMLSSLSKPQ